MLFKQRMIEIEDDMVPFGFTDDGLEDTERDLGLGQPWAIEYASDI